MLSILRILKPKERLYLSIFVWLALLMWCSSQLKSFKSLKSELADKREILAEENRTIGQEDAIAFQLEEAQQGFDASKTYSTSRLQGKVDSLLREQETITNFDITSPVTKDGEIFDIHSIRVDIKNTDLKTLILFAQSILNERPYMGMTFFQITPNLRDYNELTARIEIESFEFKNIGLD